MRVNEIYHPGKIGRLAVTSTSAAGQEGGMLIGLSLLLAPYRAYIGTLRRDCRYGCLSYTCNQQQYLHGCLYRVLVRKVYSYQSMLVPEASSYLRSSCLSKDLCTTCALHVTHVKMDPRAVPGPVETTPDWTKRSSHTAVLVLAGSHMSTNVALSLCA